MIIMNDFISGFSEQFIRFNHLRPWQFTNDLPATLTELITGLDSNYKKTAGIAVHSTATVEAGAVLKAPVVIGAHCFPGAHAYSRGGVYLANSVKIGTGCEIKTGIIFNNSSIAHFNFIGDSIPGSKVNFEAGAITANHYNERENKIIPVVYHSTLLQTAVVKFGSLVGDHCKVGANAVLSPGTLLRPNSIVKRLELVDQVNDLNRTGR